jgi:glycosyltransferase involved in cell wall biosynthesis
LRIAQVAPLLESIPPACYGGTERVVATLTSELCALGHDVTLYASGDSSTRARLVPLVERAIWHTGENVDANALHVAELARVTREAGDYDVIHSHLDYQGFQFARVSPTPFVHTLHGRLDLPEHQHIYREFPDAAVVSISNSQRRPIRAANWIATVYNGIDPDLFPFGDGAGGYLAFIGRISPEKGVADAIDLAQRLEMPLKIAARMPLEATDNPWVAQDWEYYKAEVKPRLNSSMVEFIGEVGDRDKGELLKDAHALLFPIRWPEPFGLVMVEAMACGTPVIARNVGSAPEILQHGRTGFLCDTVDEMIAACRSIDQLSRSACRDDVVSRFSARAMAQGYLRAYAAVGAEGSAGDVLPRPLGPLHWQMPESAPVPA